MRPKIKPESEILFAGKTGFITKAIWFEFFAEGTDRWKQEKWKLMRERGFFRPHRSSRADDVLIPNLAKKEVRLLLGEEIPAPPFVAQLDHDEVVARSLLRLSRNEIIGYYQTESALKKRTPTSLARANRDERDKYPDALVELKSGLIVALELELTLKSRRRYRQIIRAYRSRHDVGRVIFIVRSSAIFESIRQAMLDTSYPVLERPVGFAWLGDWVQDPGTARIDFKLVGTSLEKMAKQSAD